MAALRVAVLLGLALGAVIVPLQTFRVNHEMGHTSSQGLETMTSANHKCCMIIEGNLYSSGRRPPASLQNKICRQSLHKRQPEGKRTRNSQGTRSLHPQTEDPCRTGKYPHPSNVEILKVETLETSECFNAPMCSMVTLSRCYKITEGELSPWGYDSPIFPQQEFPPGMAISVAGSVCQRDETIRVPQKYSLRGEACKLATANLSHSCAYNSSAHGARFAKLEIKAIELLGDKCEGDQWKHHSCEAAPRCDDFGFWKHVLSTEGIKTPSWQASIAAAKDVSPEGMEWGTTMAGESHKDTLWNARRDTLLGGDDRLSSWS